VLEVPFYLGLILTRAADDDQWHKPNVHGWVVKREGILERGVCEPIKVEIGT
jgi:hypothetical protein